MLLELQKGKKTVGRKQSQRAILEGKAEKIYLAEDADGRIREETEKLCETHGVPVISVDTMELQIMSLPLDRRGRLGRYVVDDAVDARDLAHDAPADE